MKKLFNELEKYIENSILDYLAARDIYAWKVKSVGTYDVKRQGFRMPSKRYKRGVSDILGIYRGKPLAIEVKSANGRLSPAQKLFLTEFLERGGIAMVAKSVDEVEFKLNLVLPCCDKMSGVQIQLADMLLG